MISTRPPIILSLLVILLPLLLPNTATAATPSVSTATFLLYDNGSSTNGTVTTLHSTDFPSSADHPMEEFAVEMSHRIDVSKHGEKRGSVVATKAFRGDGEKITHFHQLLPPDEDDTAMQRVYLVADGLEFIWPFIKYGYNQTVSQRALTPLDPSHPVVLSSVSETPRVFIVYNLFSPAEADQLIEHNLKSLKRSTTGNNVRAMDKGRTSENSWDSQSPVAKKMITRSFNLTGIHEDAGKVDGLQVVRYLEKQFYNVHHDYFQQGADQKFDFMPYAGGSNRFATLFMYVSDPLEGGHTVFPSAPNHNPPDTPPPPHALELFSPNSLEYNMVRDCHNKASVPPARGTAALFYSSTPDGQMDRASLHGACPVISGVKWGANIWIWNRQRFGLLKSGKKRNLEVRNDCEKKVYIAWEGKANGNIEPGKSYQINSFEFHRFKASFVEGGKAFAEFTVQGKKKDLVWVITEPRQFKKKDAFERLVSTKGMAGEDFETDEELTEEEELKLFEEDEESQGEEDEEEEEEEDDILRLWKKRKRRRKMKKKLEKLAAYYKGDDDEEL